MAQQLIAIDVSGGAARIAVIEATFRKAVLVMAKSVVFEPDLPAAEVWERIREAVPMHIDALVIGLDARSTSTRQLNFPFSDMRKVESAIAFELESQLPYALDDVVITWTVTERRANEVQVLAAVTPKALVAQHLLAMEAARFEPRAIMLPGAALAELHPAEDPVPTALISLGATQTHVAIARNGLHFVRCLRVGGDDIDRALAKRFNVSLADAKQAKEGEARLVDAADVVPDDVRALSDTVGAALGTLTTGLVATFKSLPPIDTPARVILTGGLSRLPGIDKFLSGRLGVPVDLLDVRASIDTLAPALKAGESAPAATGNEPKVGPEYAVALGMALSLFRRGRDLPLNFRRGALAYHGDIQAYRGTFTRAAIGLSVVFSLAIFASVVRYTVLRGEERQLDQGFCSATQRIVGREICDPTAALATLKQASGEGGAVIPSFSASMLLEMASKAVTSEIDVQFDELDLRVDGTPGQPERVTGKGEAASFESTEQLVSLLKRDPCVQDAEVSNQRKTQSNGRVEFKLGIKVMCPVGVVPGAPHVARAPNR